MTIWTEYSRCYDRVMQAWTPYQALLAQARDALRDTSRVLDVGCGTGLLASSLRQDVKAIDSSAEMVAVARARGVDAAVADASRLPFPDGCFDGAACINVILCVDEPAAMLREIRRVVRPGGVLAISGLKPAPDLNILREETIRDFTSRGLHDVLRVEFPKFQECNAKIGQQMKNLYELPEIVRLLRLLGFADVVSVDQTLYHGQAWLVAVS